MRNHATTAVTQDPPRAVARGGQAPTNDAANGVSDDPEVRRQVQALALIAALRAVWPTLVQLTTDQRERSTGRLVASYETGLRALFTAASAAAFAPTFALLRVDDEAGAASPFDPARALAHLDRALSMREVAAELRALADVMDDDALHHGALAVDAGRAALKIARPLAEHNPEFRALVGHALDAFTAMTAPARRAKPAATPPAPNGHGNPQP